MIYLDNAATSWPKPAAVIKAMEDALQNFGFNPGRGVHQATQGAYRLVSKTRELLAQLFGIQDPKRIVLTLNATYALNMAIQGLLNPGDHVITSSMEHNSVWRPLKYLERCGIELDVIQADTQGRIDPDQVKLAIKPGTKLIAINHASNVTGTILPITEIGEIARLHNIPYLVDASQTAGVLPIDVKKMHIDLLAFPGHKGLMGPQGTGGLYVGPNVSLRPLIQGGTGSNSESELQPDILPDKYESGTLNTVGIAGLGAGVEHVLTWGVEQIYQREIELCRQLVAGLENIPGVILYGPTDWQEKVPVVSLNVGSVNSNEIGFILDRVYQIAARTGLHCAPQAHRTIGTLEQGTVRLSPSTANTPQDIEQTIEAIKYIASEMLI